MRNSTMRLCLGFVVLLAAPGGCAPAPAPAPDPHPREATVTVRASGTFEVSLTHHTHDEHPGGITLGRTSLDKVFHGDLDGTSHGQMLTARSPDPGSAGYVAIERVSGTLHGRTGTFVLQHSGTMTAGDQDLAITVVPATGTGQLTGLAGRMTISIDGGIHAYEFHYTLPES